METIQRPGHAARRRVSPSATLGLLFGSARNLLGWVFLAFSPPLLALAGDSLNLGFWYDWTRPQVLAAGAVTGVESTGTTINERRVMAYRFEYDMPDGRIRSGRSYSTERLETGAEVIVGYPEGYPEFAVIRGQGRTASGLLLLLTLVFPAVGLGLVIFGLRRGWQWRRLVREGLPARGRLVEKRATNVRINKKRVYALTFEFEDIEGRTRRATIRTHRTAAMEDEPEEQLLYLPDRPERIVLLDQLPIGLQIDARSVRPHSPPAALAWALVPLAALGLFGFMWTLTG